jgi:hypothetical protein
MIQGFLHTGYLLNNPIENHLGKTSCNGHKLFKMMSPKNSSEIIIV